MGIKRVVDMQFWTDGKVDQFSPEDKYFMLYLLTNPFTKQLGIYEISIKQAAFQIGYSEDVFNTLLDRFENKYHIIKFSKETNEIAVMNFLRHSVMKGGKPVEDCIKQDMAKVKNKKLIDEVFSSLYGRSDLNVTVKKIVDEYINDNDIYNDNDNDNDRTGDESSHESSTEGEEPVKNKYGEFNNVLLTDAEMEKLKNRFSDYQEKIEKLSCYLASKGKRYKSHYATILNWERGQKRKPAESTKTFDDIWG